MSTTSTALAPGSVVDSLRIDRILGQGAFGITYLVTDQVIGASFALKEYQPRGHCTRLDDGSLRPESGPATLMFAKGMQHFLDEGRTVAPLDHPNIVKLFRCFEANGTAYLLMNYYKGEALHTLLQRSGTLSAEEATALTLPLLDALEYIHANGVIHQDIKPANIYITEDGDPILLDFGAAGQRRGRETSGAWKPGSEGYAAPEQSSPRINAGPWTDVYGLAATLYRAVTGKIPPPATARQQALRNRAPDPLIALRDQVPDPSFAPIARAISRGLEISPEKRPPTVADWRASFTPQVSKPGPYAPPPAAGIETEGREWLPIILLAIFLMGLFGIAFYLLTGDSADSGDSSDGVPVSEEVVEPTVSRETYVSTEERNRWKQALEADTAYAYQLFMKDFPESINRKQAQAQIDILDDGAWQETVADGSKTAMETYLERFPGGKHEAEALIRLDVFRQAESEAERQRYEAELQENEDWERARSARSLAAVDAYLSAWPGGRHAAEAQQLRQQLSREINDRRAFDAAAKINTIDAYRSYIDAFPGGSKVATALERIDDLTLRPGKTFSDCELCPSMVVVPSGSFWQGSEDSSPLALNKEKPRRMVSITEAFAVGVYEVTMAQWDACVADGGCSTRPDDKGWGRDSRPVIMVSWNDAQEYASWLSRKTGQAYRLPSESEWEYIARAGEESDWPGGNPQRICDFGNIAGGETGFRWAHSDCADRAALSTLPAGSFQPNAFGVYDAVGNVAEWTLDCMNLSYLDAPADGSAWGRGICSSRMTRGGSWVTGTKEIRLPARFNLKAGDRNDFTGFRLVRAVEDP
jgi:formylglycine-generating enzyme required for sulfatase activity/serine/threonine protein kinase